VGASDARVGAAMIVGTSATIQLSAALAHGLFSQLGPTGVSALRFGLGAAILAAAVRPSLRGRDRATWLAIVAYGVALAALNLAFFGAIERIPIGIAVTFAFVAPLILAVVRSRRRRDVAIALLAGVGVVILGGVDRPGSWLGVALALSCGASWVAVAYAARHVGANTRRVDGLALALPFAALIALPLGIGHADRLDLRAFAIGVVIAVAGLILPFALELEGLRRLEPRAAAVIYSIDPAIAAAVGLVALGQGLTLVQAVGVTAVTAASVCIAIGG
jgi:inner membrane transporter RhtA